MSHDEPVPGEPPADGTGTDTDSPAAGGPAAAPGPPAGEGAAPLPAEGTPPPAALVEFHRLLAGLTPHVYMTPLLVAANVLVFAAMAASGVSPANPKPEDLVRWGGNFGPATTSGEWWRLFTCVFVHIGILHLALNMWALAAAGPLVERMVGNANFLLAYVVAGLTGSLASLFWNQHLVSVGASGAIFGVYGTLLALLLRQHGSIPREPLTRLRGSGVTFVLYNLLFGLFEPKIDNAAHLGGLAGGFLCGLVLSQPLTTEAVAGRAARFLQASVLGAALVAGGVVAVLARPAGPGPDGLAVVHHGNYEVFYGDGAAKEDADRLGDYLEKKWGGTNRASVQLRKTGDGYLFRMVVKPEFQKNAGLLQQLEFDGARLSRDVFGGAALEVQACDEHFETLRSLPPRADMRYGVVAGTAEVFYAAAADRADAQRLADYVARGLQGKPATFKLARRGPTVEVHMVFRQDLAKDAVVLDELQQDRNALAAEVFPGAPVELHLCDEVLKEFRIVGP